MERAAVLAPGAGHDAELATFRAGDAGRPFLDRQHQNEANPSEEKSDDRPADALCLGKGVAASQQKTCQRRGRRREEHQGKVSGNQPAGRSLVRRGSGDVVFDIVQIMDEHGLLHASL